MKSRIWILGICSALLLSGCATSPGAPVEPDRYEVIQEDTRIIYRGPMSGRANAEVEQILREAEGQIEWLEIESGGGNVDWGLDLGDLVVEHDLNVRVFGIGCHSSCANYVFTAGNRRVIEPGAIVTWHGSALQRQWGFRDRLRRTFFSEFRASYENWALRQAQFFERVGVDERVTIVGQDLECSCIWALSVEDMAKFGLINVEATENYTETDTSQIPHAKFLELPSDVFERIRPPENS
ncbi:MAG: hypothetical protein ACXIUB_10930 [Wenzhouxiangella sp.]